MTTRKYSAAEKRECAERELKMRLRVYPRWVADGKMSRQDADREIELMRQIEADYSAQRRMAL